MTATIHDWCDRLDDPDRGLRCPCAAWQDAHARDTRDPQKGTAAAVSSLSGATRGRNGAFPSRRVTTERGRAA